MASDQIFRKLKKRAKKNGLNQPKPITRKGNRCFLVDTMAVPKRPRGFPPRSLNGDRTMTARAFGAS